MSLFSSSTVAVLSKNLILVLDVHPYNAHNLYNKIHSVVSVPSDGNGMSCWWSVKMISYTMFKQALASLGIWSVSHPNCYSGFTINLVKSRDRWCELLKFLYTSKLHNWWQRRKFRNSIRFCIIFFLVGFLAYSHYLEDALHKFSFKEI